MARYNYVETPEVHLCWKLTAVEDVDYISSNQKEFVVATMVLAALVKR